MTHPFRLLHPRDRAALSALSDAVGWSQSIEVCGNIIKQSAGHCLGVEYDGCLVGCAAAMRYPDSDVAHLFEVIVHPDYRRRGIARALVQQLQWRLADCPTLRLHATPEGKTVYTQLGFHDYRQLGRYRGLAWGPEARSEMPGLQPMTPNDLTGVIDFDRRNFGVTRRDLLMNLYCRCPEGAFAVRREGRLAGFVLIRGNEGNQRTIGPLEAETQEDGVALLAAAGANTGTTEVRLTIDLFDHNPALADFLIHHGGKKITPMTAMQFGVPLPPPAPAYMAPMGADIG